MAEQLMKLLFSFSLIGVINGIPQFSFIPSPNITILQSAVYQCAVTGVSQSDTVPIHWRVNGISSTSGSAWQSYITSTGITVIGAGTRNTILTIPGEPVLNETTVECIALGLVDGEAYTESDSAILYIQGRPASVDLYCSLFTVYSIQCNWSIPYTIGDIDITGYNINITDNENNLINMTTVTNTEYYYNVSQFGEHNISVATVIGDELEGEINTVMVEVPEVMIDDWLLEVYFVGDILRVNCTILDTMLNNLMLPCKFVLITISSDNIQENYDLEITGYQNRIIGEKNLNFGRDKRNASIMVEYDSGLQVYSSDRKLLNTFHVQLLLINTSVGQVCFECVLLTGSNGIGCLIEYTCGTNTSNNITITNDTQGCVNIIHTCDYSIIVYDIDSNGTVYTNRPAYQTHAIINGASDKIVASASQTFSFSTAITSLLPTLSNEKAITQDSLKIAIIVPVAAIMFIVVVVISVSLLVCCLKKNNVNKDSSVSNSHPPVADNPCYESVTAKTNRLPVADNPCYDSVTTTNGLPVADNLCYESVMITATTSRLPVADNPCYDSVTKTNGLPVADNPCYDSVTKTNRLPVADNPCYESVIKKDGLQCTVAVPNPCYEVVSTEQHKTTDEHMRTTNTNNMN